MRRALILAAVPAVLTLSACGGGGNQDITLTNDSNVVLNDAQANYAFSNDGEVAPNDTAAMNAMEAVNETDANMAAMANATGNGM